MAMSSQPVVSALRSSFAAGQRFEAPYRHWLVKSLVPESAIDDLNALPFPAPSLDGVSGKREVHNATRKYFDVENRAKFPVIGAISEAFQDPAVTSDLEGVFGTRLAGTYLRIEYAQDTDSFWLEPHSDLGVKLFTLLLYVSRDPSHADLGTDIYDGDKKYVGRMPFAANSAMVFVPSKITMHGFEPRPIKGVRKSVIVNYVSDAWIAREQLAYPDRPIGR